MGDSERDSLVCFQLDCSTYELERLHTKVTSLCNRIDQIQCHNAKDRLAQSGKMTSISSSPLGKPACRLGCVCALALEKEGCGRQAEPRVAPGVTVLGHHFRQFLLPG